MDTPKEKDPDKRRYVFILTRGREDGVEFSLDLVEDLGIIVR